MSAAIIDGRAIAATIRSELKVEVGEMQQAHGRIPGLAAVLVGERKDSQTYVRMKKKACAEVGIRSFGRNLPADISQEDLLSEVRALNENPGVHGILVQLPLPDHIDDEEILGAISLEKDVDGFHPLNIGRLSMKRRDPLFVPCTPKGCIELLDRSGVAIEGKQAVVLGRSNIVGLPVAMLLLHRNATLTVCHSRTADLPEVVRGADILIAAVGRAEMVRGDWLKPGVVVIDVGVNAVDDNSTEKGYRLVGDVAFDEAIEVAAAITPVPGGVGPMTIAMLLRNTVDSARRAFSG
ncbi:MAG: bifunctional methylenetetrahydrofolate dehydrogenase/methenyltetrahydrofolate cyclohydrolase FolD [Xanthomonadales bacterium]|nr:bifunctional methylenetetrahydrofolate dehydrogenase/methenyltetrahydrofolate cyclohydrolase FolD [Xanthomonadales bacterium]NIX14102.1 bifunctional methylenetetrahydrofolate dehydrogenase/methenyltetrahydrofolate cyclohydrolase FolD [Xanthomonadales bacterium]